jgi:hypothetical protein
MKLVYSLLLSLGTITLLFAQQTFSSFPVAIDKAEYDDREAVFVTSEDNESGVFLSDNNVAHFIKLNAKGEPEFDVKQNMPLNYGSIKRAGVGTLGNNYFCYFLQGNKKIMAFQVDATAKAFNYISFPFTADKDPILFIASGPGYLYVVTSSGENKNECVVYKYTTLNNPKISKVAVSNADLYKSLGITPNKSTEQTAVFPLNRSVQFAQTASAAKVYHDTEHLIISYDAPEYETRILDLTAENPALISIKSIPVADKKSVFRSILFQDHLFQLTVSVEGVKIKNTDLSNPASEVVNDASLDPDFYVESSYSNRIGYNRERKGATKADLIKSFNRSDLAGLGVLESSDGRFLLIAGLANSNNISDPEIDNSDNEQKQTLNVNVTLERKYSDLHLPSYAADQNALLRFKKEIWVYTYWTIDANSHQLSKSFPQDIPALDESLDLFYRDPLNNVAPAVWKPEGQTYLFGFYNHKNQNYNLFKISGKQAGGNMNRR